VTGVLRLITAVTSVAHTSERGSSPEILPGFFKASQTLEDKEFSRFNNY